MRRLILNQFILSQHLLRLNIQVTEQHQIKVNTSSELIQIQIPTYINKLHNFFTFSKLINLCLLLIVTCLQIYDGHNGEHLTTLCGKLEDIENHIEGVSNSVKLVFETDHSVQKTGWKIKWKGNSGCVHVYGYI